MDRAGLNSKSTASPQQNLFAVPFGRILCFRHVFRARHLLTSRRNDIDLVETDSADEKNHDKPALHIMDFRGYTRNCTTTVTAGSATGIAGVLPAYEVSKLPGCRCSASSLVAIS